MFKVSCGLLKLGFIGVYSYKNWRNCSMECLHGSEKANTQLTCHYWGLSIKWHAAPACNQGCFVLTQNYWLNWTLWLSLPTACWRPTPSPASTAPCCQAAIPRRRRAGCTELSTNCCYRNDNHLFTAKKWRRRRPQEEFLEDTNLFRWWKKYQVVVD